MIISLLFISVFCFPLYKISIQEGHEKGEKGETLP